jgi:hypothetical protein
VFVEQRSSSVALFGPFRVSLGLLGRGLDPHSETGCAEQDRRREVSGSLVVARATRQKCLSLLEKRSRLAIEGGIHRALNLAVTARGNIGCGGFRPDRRGRGRHSRFETHRPRGLAPGRLHHFCVRRTISNPLSYRGFRRSCAGVNLQRPSKSNEAEMIQRDRVTSLLQKPFLAKSK